MANEEEFIEGKSASSPEKNKKTDKTTVKKEIKDWLIAVVIAVVAMVVLTQCIVVNASIPSASMEDTIMTGDRVIGLRFAYWFSDVKRGDIVIFKYPDDERQLFVKRVIGLPGETVEIKDGKVYIDGSAEPLEEEYLKDTPRVDLDVSNGVYEVPEGYYFMLGDNRNFSKDSRYWENKYVAKDKIIGEAWLRIYPHFGLLDKNN